MILTVLDTETTGLKPETDQIIEIAAVNYHVESKTIIGTVQALVHAPSNPVESINHISQMAMDAAKDKHQPYVDLLFVMVKNSDYLVAHNAKFDKGFVEKYVGNLEKPWVCSKEDLKFPNAGKSSRLGHLAYDHNIPVFNAHRGLTDVHILVDLLMVLDPEELKRQIFSATQPKELYMANVSYEDRDKAKSAGFWWEPTTRSWRKTMTSAEADLIKNFTVTKVG